MKALRTTVAGALAVVLVLALTGCGGGQSAAKVNGTSIPVSELNQQIAQLQKQYPTMFQGADGAARLLQFKQRLLDTLVNQTLVEQAAKDRGITVSDADVQKQIDQLKAGFKDQAAFDAALKSAGMDPATLQSQIRQQLVTQKLMAALSASINITPAQIAAYYNKNKSQFYTASQKRASHILFNANDKATAEKVLKQVLAGADFAQLAKQYSKDPASAAKGGDLGWPTSPYVPEFQAALDKLSKGQTTTTLVKSQFGYHIIRVTDVRPASQKTLAQATPQIKQILTQQQQSAAYNQLITELRKKAKIQIFVQDLKASQNATQ